MVGQINARCRYLGIQAVYPNGLHRFQGRNRKAPGQIGSPERSGSIAAASVDGVGGGLELLASGPVTIEYQAVLNRPERLEVIGLDLGEANEILDAVVRVCAPVALRFLWRPRLKDPVNEMVLETAANSGADWLLTFDVRHLANAAACHARSSRDHRRGRSHRQIRPRWHS
jgi:predicted nucleic acid-binding protein